MGGQVFEIDDKGATEQQTKSRNRKGILTLVGGFFLHLFLGCFFLWGNISVYVISYFHYVNNTSHFSFVYLVDMMLVLSNFLGYQVGTYLLQTRRWHPKLVIAIGGFLSLAGNFLSSYTSTLGPYLTCYTLMNGIGAGMCYLVPIICGWDYFPDRRGLVTGICLGGYGFGTFIFAQISTAIVNPDGEEPIDDPAEHINFYSYEVAMRVPVMIRELCYIWVFLVVIGIVSVSRP